MEGIVGNCYLMKNYWIQMEFLEKFLINLVEKCLKKLLEEFLKAVLQEVIEEIHPECLKIF